jgi:hypothetical protein
MQHAFTVGNLQVQREVGFETMLPIDLEPEEVDVELNGLDFIEDPQDRGGFAKLIAFPDGNCPACSRAVPQQFGLVMAFFNLNVPLL